jgi:ubiquinone/menaquinone biosynthesis C-methylase UbiE
MASWQLAFAIAAASAVTAAGALKLARARLQKARADHRNRPALWNRFYAIDWGETATNNYGFAPADGDHPQRYQHQMYRELLKRLLAKRPAVNGLRLLEVSCGRGGGLNAFLDAAPAQIRATGLDVASTAVAYCRSTYAERSTLDFVEGNALALPFDDATFDAVLNVEASNDYGDRRGFFREVARVLKPDGIFLYTDSFKSGQVEAMRADLDAAGFVAEFDDITSNVAQACRADSSRRRAVIRRHAPLSARLLIGKSLANYAAIEGSTKYRAFVDGRRTYLMAAAERA